MGPYTDLNLVVQGVSAALRLARSAALGSHTPEKDFLQQVRALPFGPSLSGKRGLCKELWMSLGSRK